ncbi:MAG TPA: Gfo/Idh/MocA family oxidoreductase [Acidimicrobiales bacterium]|nr:Gfo/Idh/MocA family oxidoreductase [Acidimicrobiales bacterium]
MTSIAFAGAGWITAVQGLAAEAVDGLSIVHVASRRGGAAARRAEQTGAVVCRFDDLPGGADAVLVATPPGLHLREAVRAVEGGAAALVETPLAATLDDADALVALAGRGHVAYAENLVHSPVVGEFVTACRRIGELTHLEIRFAQGRPDWSEHRLDLSWGGGALFDLGVHALAVVLLAAAPARVVSVRADLAAGDGLDIDDDATVTLTFDTGLRAQLRATWRAAAPAWDAQAASPTGAVRLELVPEPAVELNGRALRLPAPPAGIASPQLHHLGYVGELAALTADIAARRRPRSSVAFGRLALDIIAAAYTSARTGVPEPVPFTGPRDRTPFELWAD